ncbi:SAM-dependent methyltransferase [Chloroflexus sp.]|uniref:SAM-dependent methyltransferase n=1 Tax=Chloroflexus sp. TaxID=1904827 RepID=UPI002ACD8505|nr:SAM-dependent methyltransferase [Chloroflexus sp.]
MKTDFLDAHHRHWEDAELLFAASRWANADHLYGLAAECGLKRLMIVFGMPVNSSGAPALTIDRVHADQAWVRYEVYRSGRGSAKYQLSSSNPFNGWRIGQRYANRANFNKARAQAHRKGAEKVRNLIEEAVKDGWI